MLDMARNSAKQRFFIPTVILHLAFGLLWMVYFSSVSVASAMMATVLVFLCALVFGKTCGLVSGLFIVFVQLLSLTALHVRTAGFTLSILPAILEQPDWVSMVILPAFGYLSGALSDKLGISNQKDGQQVASLKEENQSLLSRITKYEAERSMRASNHEHLLPLAASPNARGNNEKLTGALLASITVDDLTVPGQPLDPLLKVSRKSDAAWKLFDLLIQARPEVLAVMEPDGRIIRSNAQLMAIYGLSSADDSDTGNILHCLTPEDADRATKDLAGGLQPGLRSSEHYAIKTPDGGYSRLLISPQIRFEGIENPPALIACVSSRMTHDVSYGRGAGSALAIDLHELSRRNLCCLTQDHRIYYTNPRIEGLLGKASNALMGKEFQQLISRSEMDRFEAFLKICKEGKRSAVDIEMLPREGKRRIFRLDAYPAMSALGRYLGCSVLIEDVTGVKLVEESLQHRLSMEKMISSISTRFISMKVEDLDNEISHVLQMIGDFEESMESYVEIYQSARIRQPAKFKVVNQKMNEQLLAGKGPAKQLNMERYEMIAIPIVIDSESMGYFRFYLERFRSNWLETDTELIRLIGEIIINALIRKENEMDIKLKENRLATTLHSIGEGVIATDREGQIVLMNQTAEQLTGWSREQALDQPIDRVFKPYKPKAVENDPCRDNEFYHLTETDNSMVLDSLDGKQYYISSNRSKIEDRHDLVYGEVTVFRDVTKEKKENDEIRYISYHDKLTGLYNRAFFEEELVRLNTTRQYPLTLIIGDCNGLKIANDIFGHMEGDRLLQTIARILKKATRHEDIVARWGGDEFAIILPKTNQADGIEIQERILQLCVEAPFDPIQPSLAMGSATNTEAGIKSNDMKDLLKMAEDRMYRHKLMEGRSARNTLLMSIKNMLFEKSYETQEHANRLKDISERFGHAVGLSSFEQEELSLLAILHDVGKVGIPDMILTKPDRLNDEEWGIMKKHSEKGYKLAKSTPELNNIADYILHHHERWDGSGYPSGLHGENIPKLSRILSLVDAYDVMTHSRAYKEAQSKIDALKEIEKCAGSQFDPHLADIFIQIMNAEDHDQEEGSE